MTDVMIDIESLSTSPNATILTIGALKFNRKDRLKPLEQYDKFYIRVNIKSCEDIGCHIDPKTIDWWNEQKSTVRYEAIENPDRVSIKDALYSLSNWIGNSKIIWANSPSFDCVILEYAYKQCRMEVPWKWWLTRDVRTILDLAGIRKNDLPNEGEHHALHDCYQQLIGVKRALKKLGI